MDDDAHDDRAERFARRLFRPDGIVLRSNTAIVDFVKPYTVALVGPNGPGLGSGLLVQLWGRYFISTAGHVIRKATRLGPPLRLVITARPFDAQFSLHGNYVVGEDADDADFGYFEIPANDAGRIKAQDKVFAGPNRLRVFEPVSDDLYVVSGFPEHRAAKGDTQGEWSVQLHCWTTGAAGFRNVPAAPPPSRAGLRLINLALDPSALITEYTGRGEPPDAIKLKERIDDMSSASGGPCWRTFAPTVERVDWSTDAMKVVAIHRATGDRLPVADGGAYTFAREVSVGHHLKMIAEQYADLRERILAEWPLVADYPDTATFR